MNFLEESNFDWAAYLLGSQYEQEINWNDDSTTDDDNDDENEKNKSTFLENENKQMKEVEWKPAEDIEQENQ